MKYLTCVIYIPLLIQVATAQILGVQNNINQPPSNQVHRNPANNTNIDNTASNIASTGLNLNDLVANSMPGDATNLQRANLRAANINNGVGNTNNANIANQIGLARANNIGAPNRYSNVGNGLTNGNLGRYNIGNNVNSGVSVNGLQGSQAYGISVTADALEIGGQLAVNGRIPFYSAVAVNSELPTEGSATVSYTCGRPEEY